MSIGGLSDSPDLTIHDFCHFFEVDHKMILGEEEFRLVLLELQKVVVVGNANQIAMILVVSST